MPGLEGRVIYQIYPRSFADSNGDGIGDLRGITDKLDYLGGDGLGVDYLWLSPFFRSPMADFGYDVSDYHDVDPVFGTLDDFKALLAAAHARGLKVLIDLVPNHTSDLHPWFEDSRSSRNSSKRDWYVWRDAKADGSPPNNWPAAFGGPAWTFDEASGQYYLHSFLPQQPDLNWANPEVRAAIQEVMRFWLDLGVDGFRVDAVDRLSKDADMRDNPPNPDYREGRDNPAHAQLPRYSRNGPELAAYLSVMSSVVAEYPGRIMVTETYPDRPDRAEDYLALYDLYPDGAATPFDFGGVMTPWEAPRMKRFIDAFHAGLPAGRSAVHALSNHDKSRIATRFGPEAARTAAVMLLGLPGAAVVYYGDELGMRDVPVPSDEARDPLELRVPGMGLGRDPQRTPMRWTEGPHAGFSTGEPWLPVGPDVRTINAELQAADPDSMLSLYRELIRLRRERPALSAGRYEPFETGNQNVFAYLRRHEHETLLVVLNFGSSPVDLGAALPGGETLLSSVPSRLAGGAGHGTTLRPHEGRIIELSGENKKDR